MNTLESGVDKEESKSEEQLGKERLVELLGRPYAQGSGDFGSFANVSELKKQVAEWYEKNKEGMIRYAVGSTIAEAQHKKTGSNYEKDKAVTLRELGDGWQESALEMDELGMLLRLYAKDDSETLGDLAKRLQAE